MLPLQDDTNYSDLIGKLTARFNDNGKKVLHIAVYQCFFFFGSCVSSIAYVSFFRELYCRKGNDNAWTMLNRPVWKPIATNFVTII